MMSLERATCPIVHRRRGESAARVEAVRVLLTDTTLEVRLARWEKALGLMRSLDIPRADLSDVEVVEEPVRAAMGTGIKVGLRVPWLYFVARTIGLDRAFVVRRGVPALSFAVANHGALRHVLVSTPDAHQIARELQPAGVSRDPVRDA
jgi:hypothetical protein